MEELEILGTVRERNCAYPTAGGSARYLTAEVSCDHEGLLRLVMVECAPNQLYFARRFGCRL